LNELGEAEQPGRALASRRGLEDPDDPYRDTRRDDGSLAWLQRRAEQADRDPPQFESRFNDGDTVILNTGLESGQFTVTGTLLIAGPKAGCFAQVGGDWT